MSTSYSDSISQIYGIHNEAKRWTTGAINIIVATSKANDLPLKINLTETLGHGKKVPRANKRGDHNCYWLPSSINENNDAFRRKHIHPLFTTACWHAGFIIHAEYEADDTCIVFKCFHSKHHNEEKQSEYRNNRERQVRNPDIPPLPRTWRKSARPVFGEEDHILCSFKLRLYYDELSKRWFLPKQQSGNPHHCGHIWEPPEHLRIQCHLAPKEEVQISSDAMNAHVPISATGSLFHERTGMTLEAHQLRYLQKQNLKTDDLLMDAGTGPPVTAMDKLLAELRSDPACHFICLYGEFNSNLLTIKTRKRASTNNAESIEEFTTNLEDTSDSPRKFAEDYRNSRSSLKDTSNGKIVLAIAWTNDEARRKMDMFPEFLGGDDTEETNSEDRPFYTMCGKDSYNKSFGHTWCFMPSKCQWVYEWMFGTALPVLHPGTSLSRVQILVTDDDKQETRAANNNCGRGVDVHRSLPNARHRHCAWHKINRNFTENAKYKSKLSTVKKRSYKAAIEVDTIIKWLWYFIKYYESTEEVNFAYQLLDLYLTEDQTSHFGDIDDNVRQDIKEFITKNFHLHRTTLYESEYPSIMTLGNCTTSVNEAEHRVYKHHSLGPRPCDNVATAAKKINKLNKMREGTKTRQVAHDMRSSLGTSEAREMVDERLTDRCNKTLLSEHDAANKHYSLYRPSQFQFYVKRNYFASPSTAEDDLHLTEQQRAALFDKIDPNDLCLFTLS